MGDALRQFAEIGAATGMPAMVLTPLNTDAARFYSRLGFAPYDGGTRMFLPLKSVLLGLNELAQEELLEANAGQAPLPFV